ncbi:MAG: PfkB family carbohydrate kinase [Planctomycetota bacterium]|nr:PfkB family carbohydrate kinase [Planctomycetota bacterium]
MTDLPPEVPALCVVGTVAFDDVETPSGTREGILGGSATYFSVAASHFANVGLVGVVGEDFPNRYRSVLSSHDVDLSGLVVQPGGQTFHWSGRYEGDMDQAETLKTDLNVLETFAPELPSAFRACPYVFLANTDPHIQMSVLEQLEDPRLVVMDTMNLWIDIARDPLLAVIKRVDGLMINDAEAKSLSGEDNLIAAGRALLDFGPRFVIVKKGEHGSFLFSDKRLFALPSYPLDVVVDPTGAGDSFAGGVMGYLAGQHAQRVDDVCSAMLYGTAVASFTVSDFSLDVLGDLDRGTLEERADEIRRFVRP